MNELKIKKFKNIISKLKDRKINIVEALSFRNPENLKHFNKAIRDLEKRRKKRFTKNEYNFILNKIILEKKFLYNCLKYKNNKEKYSVPSLTYIRNEKDILLKYSQDNIQSSDLKIKTNDSSEKSKKISELKRISKINNIEFDFFEKYNSVEKVRFLLNSVSKGNRNLNFDSETKKEFIKKFYHDSDFNKYLNLFKETDNKFLKPSLDHILPISKGGKNDLENLQFISYLENISKSNMTEKEWQETKKNLDIYFR